MKQMGAVIFDDPKAHNDGWACVYGNDPIRIAGTQDLSSNVVWVTNIDADYIYSTGLGRNSRFRHSRYLNEKMDVTLRRLGVPAEDTPKRAEVYAALFARVMTLVEGMLGIKHPPPYMLAAGIREEILPPDDIYPPEVQKALIDSNAVWGTVERYSMRYKRNQVYHNFYLPGVTYALAQIASGIPVGEWRALQTSELPKGHQQTLDWIKSMPLPCVAKVVVNDIDDKINQVLNFGGALGRGHRREWVAIPELAVLATYSDLTITRVLAAEGYQDVPKLKAIANRIDDAYDLSISASLFFMNLWLAMGRTMKTKGQNGVCNPASPFLRSLDRMRCMKVALSLLQKGSDVLGYGIGRVMTAVLDVQDEQDLADIAYQHGLIPEALGLNQQTDDQLRVGALDNVDTSETIVAVQSLYVRGDTSRILEIDKQLIGI